MEERVLTRTSRNNLSRFRIQNAGLHVRGADIDAKSEFSQHVAFSFKRFLMCYRLL